MQTAICYIVGLLLFETIANILPFAHAANAARYAIAGEYSQIMIELWWVIGYAVVLMCVSIIIFTFKMKRDK